MHAVLVEVDTSGQPDQDAGLRNLREEVVPSVSQAPGFQAGYWLRPLEDAKGTSLVLFDTEADAIAASQELDVGSSVGPGVTVVRKELREVAASA
jgi:heme-degrading monooxygenase HmoA